MHEAHLLVGAGELVIPLLNNFQGSFPELIGSASWPGQWLVTPEAQAEFQKLSEMCCPVSAKGFAALKQLVSKVDHMQPCLQ